MPNMKKVISSHNKKVQKTADNVENGNPGYNCRAGGDPCPMDGRCLVDTLVYKATVTDTNKNMETYTGLTSTTFKRRHYAQKSSFRRRKRESSTTLSSQVWNLKDKILISSGVWLTGQTF